MKLSLKNVLAAFIPALAARQSAEYEEFEKGAVAAEEGDYSTALRIFRCAAERGNADGQFNLALMYQDGQGCWGHAQAMLEIRLGSGV